MKSLRLVCLDPGFAALGYASLEVFVDGSRPRVVDFGLIRTAKSSKKQNVFAVEDNLRRAMEIARKLRFLVASAEVGHTIGMCAEAMSFPRNASVAGKMCLTWGAMASLSEATSIPILQSSPQDVKMAVCGVKSATKEEVIAAVEKLYPEVVEFRKPYAEGLWEHPHDAVAVGHRMLSSEVVKMALRAA